MANWNAYIMNDHDPPQELTMGPILKSMSLFERNFKVDASPVGHPKLFVWTLELEEKIGIRTRSSKTTAPTIRKFTFALSVSEEILFVNKPLIKKLIGTMAKALHCKNFSRLQMDSGNPSNLLMLYTQSTDQNPGILTLQYQISTKKSEERLKDGTPLTEIVEDSPDHCKNIHLLLGNDPELIPQISKVSMTLDNVPVHSKNPKLKGYRFEDVEMQIKAPSVFHLYTSLAELNIIKDIPEFIVKMRARGTTECHAHYN